MGIWAGGGCQTQLWEGKMLQTFPLQFIFPKIGSGDGSSCVEPPLLFPISVPTRNPWKAPEQEWLQEGTSPRGPIPPCGSAHGEMALSRTFWGDGLPQKFLPIFSSIPAPWREAQAHILQNKAFLFPSDINSNSPHGAEVTPEAATSPHNHKKLAPKQKTLLELTSLSWWRTKVWKQEIMNCFITSD